MNDVVVFRKRRGIELLMLILAMGIPISAYLLTNLNLYGELPLSWIPGIALYVLGGLAAHAVVRWRIPYADPLLLPLVYLLNGIGLAMIHRLDQGTSPIMHSAELQLIWTMISIVGFAAVIVLIRDHANLQRFPFTMFLIGIVTLMLPLVPGLGRENHGAQIWIQIGRWNFQPAELAKIVLSIAFASYLVEKKEVLALAGARFLGIDLPRVRDLMPIALMWLASLAVLVYQKDLGTSLLFFGLFVMMLYVATERPSWPILGTVMFLGGAFLGWLNFTHVQTRVGAWLNPFSDFDRNYQLIQGQFGMAWGGLFGTGWGLGRPNLTPLAKNDFIAAALAEEIGLAGLMAIIVIYGIIVMRGLRAALTAREPFGKLLAAGLSFVFALQVFAILGGVTRLLPLTGLTTPFVSQGGSSLIANYAMIGLLMVVTHHVRKPQTTAEEPQQWLIHDTTQVIALPNQEPQKSPPQDPTPDEPTQVVSTPPEPTADEPTQVVPAQVVPAQEVPAQVVPAPHGATPDEPTQVVPR